MRSKEKKKEKRSGGGREILSEEAEQPLGDTHTHTETHGHMHAHKKTRKYTQLSILAARTLLHGTCLRGPTLAQP